MDDTQQTPETAYKNSKMYIYILGVVAVVFVVIALTLFKENQRMADTQSTTQTQTTAPTVVPTQGSLVLVTASPRSTQATPIVIQAEATSDSREVVGYDALIQYDPTAVDYVSSRSVVEGFTVFASPQDGVLAVTATKLPQATSSSVFNASTILEVTFRPKKTGTTSFTLLPSNGPETTKFVDAQTTILRPSLNEVSVEVY